METEWDEKIRLGAALYLIFLALLAIPVILIPLTPLLLIILPAILTLIVYFSGLVE